jgi:hypothetical protein
MPLFGATIFVGSFLLFLVQPMLGKAILPWFGGTPAVWTTCMLFFQVLLLGGYVYAHRLTSRLAPRRQVLVHLVVVAASLLALRILPSGEWKAGGGGEPVRRILSILGATAGPTYFVLATGGPLLQAWFSRLSTASPYPLYALSNLGSLLALLVFPTLLEPSITLRQQAAFWMAGYLAYAALTTSCALRLARRPTAGLAGRPPLEVEEGEQPLPAAGVRTLWLLLPACGSLLLLATTNQICQDVAVVPLLWILPLAVYLMSFILAFQSERLYSRRWYGVALAVALALTCYVLHRGVWLDLRLQVASYVATLFVSCMVCHGELVRLRPGARHLTLFYGMLAGGGALGGAIVTLAAPWFFRGFWEYSLGLVSVAVLFLAVIFRDEASRLKGGTPLWAWVLLSGGVAVLAGDLLRYHVRAFEDSVEISRGFFGTLRVLEEDPYNPEQRRYTLMHGRIEHGFQFTSETKRYWPTSYFGPESGVGLAIRLHPRRRDSGARTLRIGVIGLGTGTIATYGEMGDFIRFYELSPDVYRLCSRYFTYLQNSSATVDVKIGDGRNTLEQECDKGDDQKFDVLAVDAFSGDAIPVHLLTAECFRTYRCHLKDDGILAFNISNRYLNLRPVLRGMSTLEEGMSALWIPDTGNAVQQTDDSDWVLLTRNRAFIESAEVKVAARLLPPDEPPPVIWTDDFSNLFRLLRYRR